MIGEAGERCGEMVAERPARALVQALGLDDAQVLERDRGRDRMAGIGEAVRPFLIGRGQRVADARAEQHRGDRHVAGRQALGHGHDVRLDAEALGAEPAAGAPEAADHLVGDQEHVVLAADALDLGPVARRAG